MVDHVASLVGALRVAEELGAVEAAALAAIRAGLSAALVEPLAALAYDRIRARNALATKQKELEQFIYVASHDLQEPLRKVQAFGDQLRIECGSGLSDDAQVYLDRIQDAALRMRGLITDLLTYSRIGSRREKFLPVDLNSVVAAVLDDLALKVKKEGARVEVQQLPAVQGDPVEMRQLFHNLLANALKFKKADTGAAVRVRAEPADAPFRRIVVEDDGIGFDPRYKDRIFGAFQRLYSRFEYAGNGIGLAICRRITDHHGGEIAADGVPGKGARFVVTLPAPSREEIP